MLTKLSQYSTVHSSRIESNSINSTIRNRLLLQLFISEKDPCEAVALQSSTETSSSFIRLILHEEIQEILPVLILHSEDKELFD